MGKLRGYLRRLRHEYDMWTYRRRERSADGLFGRWLSQLSKCPPDVLLGPNYAAFGGVRGHLQAIQKYSSLSVEAFPPDWLASRIGLYGCQTRLQNLSYNFDASACTAIHSHVYPDFINWCRHQQRERSAFWVHTYHLNYYPEHGGGTLESWQSDINQCLISVARDADFRMSVSRWQVVELRERFGIESVYVPNGVDVAACLRSNADRFRSRYKLDRFILYVGRNDPVKNPLEFVRLAERMPEFVCVMIGGGLTAESLSGGGGQLPCNLRVLGSQDSGAVADAIAAAAVLVVTSLREGLPTLVLEGLIQGTPLVVPDEPGCLEAVAGGRFAEVYCRGDVDELVDRVRIQIERRRRDIGGLDFVRRFFDWRQIAPHLDRIFMREPAGDFCG